MGAAITTDNARYVEFLAKFTDGVFSDAKIDYLASLCSEATQDQSDYHEIKNALTLIMASAYTGTTITSFEFSDVEEDEITIDNEAHTVAITVPNGTTVTALVANFVLADGAIAKVGDTVQESGTTDNDFTNPVTYTIVAQDKITTQDYTVTVTVAP